MSPQHRSNGALQSLNTKLLSSDCAIHVLQADLPACQLSSPQGQRKHPNYSNDRLKTTTLNKNNGDLMWLCFRSVELQLDVTSGSKPQVPRPNSTESEMIPISFLRIQSLRNLLIQQICMLGGGKHCSK